MAAVERVYKIEDENTISMVIATSQAQALNHVVKAQYKVGVASALEVADYMAQGGEMGRATKSDEVPGAAEESEAEQAAE